MDWDSFLRLATVVAEIGMGAAAWRLANALKGRVESQETRQNHADARLDNHEVRIVVLERRPG